MRQPTIVISIALALHLVVYNPVEAGGAQDSIAGAVDQLRDVRLEHGHVPNHAEPFASPAPIHASPVLTTTTTKPVKTHAVSPSPKPSVAFSPKPSPVVPSPETSAAPAPTVLPQVIPEAQAPSPAPSPASSLAPSPAPSPQTSRAAATTTFKPQSPPKYPLAPWSDPNSLSCITVRNPNDCAHTLCESDLVSLSTNTKSQNVSAAICNSGSSVARVSGTLASIEAVYFHLYPYNTTNYDIYQAPFSALPSFIGNAMAKSGYFSFNLRLANPFVLELGKWGSTGLTSDVTSAEKVTYPWIHSGKDLQLVDQGVHYDTPLINAECAGELPNTEMATFIFVPSGTPTDDATSGYIIREHDAAILFSYGNFRNNQDFLVFVPPEKFTGEDCDAVWTINRDTGLFGTNDV
ncbi:hypothetical protein SeMB42_g04381 [Synchytrium endobioticum]|uniref:Peptidase A1 domain-containing protein n=1 Tax=Synchytrium endobioticum TaxID=286115 RepID=A0A507CZF5_9FUNG|nr:hypothetical protein SeMB42_g04381 [Synchytrium endobioticum]TPX45828.1 hypothetical protein SeLEV6574_g03619 [Synchytrium endobioticum]